MSPKDTVKDAVKDAVKDSVSIKKVKKVLLGRVMIVALAILIQLTWVFIIFYQFSRQSSIIDIAIRVLSIVVVLYIVSLWSNPAYKLVWSFVILSFPLVGLTIYGVFGRSWMAMRKRDKLKKSHENVLPHIPLSKGKELQEEIERTDVSVAHQSAYISNWSDFPLYTNTKTKYYHCGEVMFPDMLEDLESAEHFIFMEYFIIAEGEMFDKILEILERKVKAGVDVRMIYDDFGCVTTLPAKFYLEMEKLGIRCMKFNPLRPIMSIVMNNRDHRKILVVDGKVGYTGGLNLADEYINVKERFGYWKDTGIRLEGEGVWSFTTMFLEMWNYLTGAVENYENYKPQVYQKEPFISDGYVQPYGDSPLIPEKVGGNVYMNIIGHAREYVYIFTPYLIVDNEMLTYLRNAAKCGVDVRIVIPNTPDKKLIFWMGQSYYKRLLESGVRIYQYKPGFIHAKSFVCDDKIATVGSINMDFRSLYLHFECGVWLYQSETVMQVKQDCMDTFSKSIEITMNFAKKQPRLKRIIFSALRLFGPLV